MEFNTKCGLTIVTHLQNPCKTSKFAPVSSVKTLRPFIRAMFQTKPSACKARPWSCSTRRTYCSKESNSTGPQDPNKQDVEQVRSQLEKQLGDVPVKKRGTYPRYVSFEEGRKWAHAMYMSTVEEWEDWAYNERRSGYIPREPDVIYADKGWISWDDWLGVKTYLPFLEARDIVRSLKIRSMEEWFDICREKKLPDDIPIQPNYVYKDQGWNSYYDWLGVDPQENPVRSCEKSS